MLFNNMPRFCTQIIPYGSLWLSLVFSSLDGRAIHGYATRKLGISVAQVKDLEAAGNGTCLHQHIIDIRTTTNRHLVSQVSHINTLYPHS